MKKTKVNKLRLIVTGAGRGIGAAIVDKFSNQENSILAVDRLWTTQHSAENIALLTGDLSQETFWMEIFPKTLISFQPNILINNAGCQFQDSFLETTPKILDTTWRTNLAAPLFLSQSAIRFWIENQIPGIIINISSIHETIPFGIPSYSISKAALGMLTKELALIGATFGIRAFCVAPGSVDTPMNAQDLDTPEKRENAAAAIPLNRLCQASEVADLIYVLVKHCPYITGTTITIDGGLSLKN